MPSPTQAHRIVRARRTLADCEEALEAFSFDTFRNDVVLCLTLLRACGHVLQSEARECVYLAEANSALWPGRLGDEIFVHFIQALRNSIIKEYRAPVGWAIVRCIGQEPTYRYRILAGHYRGSNFRALVREGIEWWREYFNALEEEMVRRGHTLVDPPAPASYPPLDDDDD